MTALDNFIVMASSKNNRKNSRIIILNYYLEIKYFFLYFTNMLIFKIEDQFILYIEFLKNIHIRI